MEFQFAFNKKRAIKYKFSSKKNPHFCGTGKFIGSLNQIDEIINIRLNKIAKKHRVKQPTDVIIIKER